ncbi:MAG: hypothetical protein LBS96_09870 [Oscillospiraceae bacterium]|nr:hypothetical protein [Oscillospiraceae bacterium]
MLEALRTWAICVAISALAAGILWLLTPKGSVQKALQALIAVFLLCAFLSPLFTQSETTLAWVAPEPQNAPASPELEKTLREQQRRAVEQALTQQAQNVLADRGIEGAEILVQTDILEDGSIEIVTVQAMLPAGDVNPETIRAALRDATGLPLERIVCDTN